MFSHLPHVNDLFFMQRFQALIITIKLLDMMMEKLVAT